MKEGLPPAPRPSSPNVVENIFTFVKFNHANMAMSIRNVQPDRIFNARPFELMQRNLLGRISLVLTT